MAIVLHRNISSWKVLSVKQHLSRQNTFPAMLKGLSIGAEDAKKGRG